MHSGLGARGCKRCAKSVEFSGRALTSSSLRTTETCLATLSSGETSEQSGTPELRTNNSLNSVTGSFWTLTARRSFTFQPGLRLSALSQTPAWYWFKTACVPRLRRKTTADRSSTRNAGCGSSGGPDVGGVDRLSAILSDLAAASG